MPKSKPKEAKGKALASTSDPAASAAQDTSGERKVTVGGNQSAPLGAASASEILAPSPAPPSVVAAASSSGDDGSTIPAHSISAYILGAKRNLTNEDDARLSPFLFKQKQRLLVLRDTVLDSMSGVAQDNLRARAEGNEASAFGMHQADAGSDAYDRDFALSLLSQEQDALYEIDEAIKRIDLGTYGVCEMSGKPINQERLEAIPFTRFTVECQSQIEKQNKAQRVRQSVTSLFGLTDDEEPEREEEEFSQESKD